MMDPLDLEISNRLKSLAPRMRSLLSESLRIPSVSGDEAKFVHFIRDVAQSYGLTTDLWQASEADLTEYAVAQAKHLPLAGRPTLVVGLPNPGTGRSILFNAHSDVVSEGRLENWTFGPWSGTERDGKFYGRGACDVKGPLVSALWAMLALHEVYPQGLPGAVQLELVPGEEDCVTLGTLTSVARGYKADACIVLEPTDSIPRNASRPGVRFSITCWGKAVHGTVKWLGEDAIALSQAVLTGLSRLEKIWNDRTADPLFSVYPIARPITVDTIHGGQWQGMICDRCEIEGYVELLPEDEPAPWKQRFADELTGLLDQMGYGGRKVTIAFPETYAGHKTEEGNSLCITAEWALRMNCEMLQAMGVGWNQWAGFNSGCEAGLRANLQNTPTLVWGPGSLAQAHSADEFVDFQQVELVAGLFARFVQSWSGCKENS